MRKIDLPPHHWLVSKHEGRFVANAYSGSMGTLPNQGCLSVPTLHYRAYVDISSGEESTFRLVAESYVLQPWRLGGGKTDFERAEFESSEKGEAKAKEWLECVAAKYGF